MKKAWLFMSFWGIFLVPTLLAGTDCIPREKLADRHIVRYRAYNGTIRGCEVSPNFYTQQHKKNRGRRSRSFLIEICEGEPKMSPRIGDSFEICPYQRKAPAEPQE